MSLLTVWKPQTDDSDEWVGSLFYWNVKVSQSLRHSFILPTPSIQAILGGLDPQRPMKKGDVCLTLTLTYRHTLLIFSLKLASMACSFVLPSPCGDAVVPLTLMFLHRERATQSRDLRSSFNAIDRRIKTVVALPMRKGWLTHPDITHVESPLLAVLLFKNFMYTLI